MKIDFLLSFPHQIQIQINQRKHVQIYLDLKKEKKQMNIM